MHATLPLKKASFKGGGRWNPTPAGTSEAREPRYLQPQPTQLIERGLVAPSSLPGTPPVQRSSPARYLRQTKVGVLHAGVSGWTRPAPAGPAPPHMPISRGRHGHPGPGSSRCGAQPSAESPEGGGGALSSAGRPAGGVPPGLARAGVETPPRLVKVDPPFSLREPARRLSWWVRVVIWWSVFCLFTGTRFRWFPPTRVAGSRASSPCLMSIQFGTRGRPQPAPSSPLPH